MSDEKIQPRGICRLLGIPVITRAGCGFTCESKDNNPPPSAQTEAHALILPRTVKLCEDNLGEEPCSHHEPTYSIGDDIRIGW